MKSLVVMRNVLWRIVQDRRTLLLIVLLPLFFVLLYGNSFSGSFRNLPIVIVNQDNGLASVRVKNADRMTLAVDLAATFVSSLDTEMFDITFSDDPDTAADAVAAHKVWAALYFPQNFSHAVVNEALQQSGERTVEMDGQSVTLLPGTVTEGPSTVLTVDDANPLIADAILESFAVSFADVLGTQQASLTPESLLDVNPLYGGNIRMLDFTAPGIIGFALTLITVMLTAMAVVRERTSGTLTRILIAPVRAWEVTIGYTLAFSAVALFQAAELFLTSTLLFDIRFIGSAAIVAVIIIVFTIGLQGIATLISTVSRNEAQAMQLVLFLLIPAIMISGVFWPLETMPAAIRPLAYISPLTYANAALRKVMLTGQGWADIAIELIVLAAIAATMLVLSVVMMRRQAYSA